MHVQSFIQIAQFLFQNRNFWKNHLFLPVLCLQKREGGGKGEGVEERREVEKGREVKEGGGGRGRGWGMRKRLDALQCVVNSRLHQHQGLF